MNRTATEDFADFISDREDAATKKLNQDEFYKEIRETLCCNSGKFIKTLSIEQIKMFNEISDCRTAISAIIETNAYKAGFADALNILASL